MNVPNELYILGCVFLVVLLALWRGDRVETGFHIYRLQFFLRYRRNRRK